VKSVTGREYSHSALEKVLRSVVEKNPGPHKFSSTQFNLESPLLDKVLDVAEMIKDEDLAGEGRETVPHVTCKYGLHTNDSYDVEQLVSPLCRPGCYGFGLVPVTLGKVNVFSAASRITQRDGPEFDVVHIEVESEPLRELNALLCQLPHTDSHPAVSYTHLTLPTICSV